MPYLIVKFKVKDYALWREYFDEGAQTRIYSGVISEHVFRGECDRNEIVLVQRWHDVEKAREMFQSPAMRRRMEEAGVEGEPEFYIEAEQEFMV